MPRQYTRNVLHAKLHLISRRSSSLSFAILGVIDTLNAGRWR